jgi:hypothetical protein
MNSQMNDDELKNMSGCPHAGCDKIFSNHLTWNLSNIKTHLVIKYFQII